MTYAELAQSLRECGHDPQTVAHFVNRLVFCMFAEDVGLLPGNMFTRMLEQTRNQPGKFSDRARMLFSNMPTTQIPDMRHCGWVRSVRTSTNPGSPGRSPRSYRAISSCRFHRSQARSKSLPGASLSNSR